MDERKLWVWLAVGVVPYSIKRKHLSGGVRTVEARALFWSLSVRLRRSGRHDWRVYIPLVEQLREAVWAAILRLRSGRSPEA